MNSSPKKVVKDLFEFQIAAWTMRPIPSGAQVQPRPQEVRPSGACHSR